MKIPSRQPKALLALFCALVLAASGCRREAAQSEPAPRAPQPQASESRVAQTAPPEVVPPASPAPPTVEERHDVEQPPRAVVPPVSPPQAVPPVPVPPPTARERSLEERERRLARRQAQLREREERLRQQETAQAPAPPAPALEPEPAEPAPAPEPLPAPEPPAPPAPVTVPAGTQLDIQLSRSLSSATSKAGDTFRARVNQDILDGDQILIPAGAEIVGEVTQAEKLRKKFGGKAVLNLRFTDLVLPSGETVPIHASLRQEGENKGKQDAATIGGATAGGAILGRILDGGGGKGTLIGALLGAAAGAVIAARHPGEEVVIPEGTVLGIVFDQPAEVHRRR